MHADTNDLSKLTKIAFTVTYLPSRESFQDADIDTRQWLSFPWHSLSLWMFLRNRQ